MRIVPNVPQLELKLQGHLRHAPHVLAGDDVKQNERLGVTPEAIAPEHRERAASVRNGCLVRFHGIHDIVQSVHER